jgi:predicted amidohydrolase
MASSAISRRELAALFAARLGLARESVPQVSPAAAAPTIRVAAIQMTADLANVDSNMAKAERLVRLAFKRGARWVILPEFFTSGIAFHPDMPKAARPIDGPPSRLLRGLAREGRATVAGSFLAWRKGNVYNTFVLALPDGRLLRHDKDHPTFWENCYYIGGHDDGVLPTPDGAVGVALCWEFIRTKTATRLKGRVGMVIGGSGWWTVRDDVPPDAPIRRMNLAIMKATPGRLARMLGVPVVHAAHAGTFEGQSWPGKPVPYPSHYLGEAQIVDGRGEILARMSRDDGEGVITADISLGPIPEEPAPIPDRYWIAEFPDAIYQQWESALKLGHEYYGAVTLPYVERQFARRQRTTRK